MFRTEVIFFFMMTDYPQAIRIPGINLYYSYHRSGCADQNWDSDLYKIVDFKIIKIGNINAQMCVDPQDIAGINIYKLRGTKKHLVKKNISITTPLKFVDTKWGFIAYYWKHNYKKFL